MTFIKLADAGTILADGEAAFEAIYGGKPFDAITHEDFARVAAEDVRTPPAQPLSDDILEDIMMKFTFWWQRIAPDLLEPHARAIRN